jgi:mannosyltransferase OCH1-like enzyme
MLYRSRFLFGLLIESGVRYAIPDVDFADHANTTTPQLIPKIIHQTYKTDAIPEHWQASQQAVKDLHPDYEYMVGP